MGYVGSELQRDRLPICAMSSDDQRLERLLAWARSKHIWLHDSISIRPLDSPLERLAVDPVDEGTSEIKSHAGFGVYAATGPNHGERMLVEPKERILDDNENGIRVWPRQVGKFVVLMTAR